MILSIESNNIYIRVFLFVKKRMMLMIIIIINSYKVKIIKQKRIAIRWKNLNSDDGIIPANIFILAILVRFPLRRHRLGCVRNITVFYFSLLSRHTRTRTQDRCSPVPFFPFFPNLLLALSYAFLSLAPWVRYSTRDLHK